MKKKSKPPVVKNSRSSSSNNFVSSSSSINNNFGISSSNLNFEYIYNLDVKELEKEMENLHENLFKASSVNYSGSSSTRKQGDDYKEPKYLKKKYEFRNPDVNEDVKYIKEPQPFGNPFKLIIRPKNQSIKMNEIEDEAFNTAIGDKKKPSKLESYASIYKQKMKKGVKGKFLYFNKKEYIKYFKENKDMKKIDIKVQEMVQLHQQEIFENDKRNHNKILVKRMKFKTESLRKRSYPDSFDNYVDDNSVITVIKPEVLDVEDDPGKYRTNVKLFDDIFEVINNLMDNLADYEEEELVKVLTANFKALEYKYSKVKDSQSLRDIFENHAKNYLNINF